MKRGLYLPIVGVLLSLYLISMLLEAQINSLSHVYFCIFLVLVVLIVFGVILLAMWDTGMIGKKVKDED